jgi:undecaprenyl-diphosphatase
VSILEAIVLGIVQGLTEFLPISSTAHLRVVPAFLGWPDPGAAFTAITQLGTMLAVVIYFRRDLWRIVRTWLRSLRDPSVRSELDARLGWYLIIGTVPISIFGVAFKDQIETGARNLFLIGAMLILLGLILLLAERVGTRTRDIQQVGLRDGVVVGFAQALALVPGVSRSGATITAGLFLGMRREDAARFSFLLSVPAVVLSGLFELETFLGTAGDTGVTALIVATAFAFVSGYAAIAFLLRFLVTHTTKVFVAYRVLLGALVIALAAAGAIT